MPRKRKKTEVEETPIVEEEKTEETTPERTSTETKEETTEITATQLPPAEPPTTLEQQLLDIYNASPVGPIPLWKLLKETDATIQELESAWDSLYDQHKVPFTKFYKAA